MRLLSFLLLTIPFHLFAESAAEISAFTERVHSFAPKDVALYTHEEEYLLRVSRLRTYPADKQFYFWRHGSSEVTVPDTIFLWSPDGTNFHLLNLLDSEFAPVVVDNHDLNMAKYGKLTAARGAYEFECRGEDANAPKLTLFHPYAHIAKRGPLLAKAKFIPPPSHLLMGELVLSFQKNKKTHYVVVGYQRFNLKATTEVRSLASEKRRVFDNVHVFVGEAGKLVDWRDSSDEATGTYDGPNGSLYMNPLRGKISMSNELDKWKITWLNPDGSGEIYNLTRERLLSDAFLGFKPDSPYTRVNKEVFEKLKTILGKDIARFTPTSLPFPCR